MLLTNAFTKVSEKSWSYPTSCKKFCILFLMIGYPIILYNYILLKRSFIDGRLLGLTCNKALTKSFNSMLKDLGI